VPAKIPVQKKTLSFSPAWAGSKARARDTGGNAQKRPAARPLNVKPNVEGGEMISVRVRRHTSNDNEKTSSIRNLRGLTGVSKGGHPALRQP